MIAPDSTTIAPTFLTAKCRSDRVLASDRMKSSPLAVGGYLRFRRPAWTCVVDDSDYYPHRISLLLLAVNAMPRDKRLAELARSLHRASERLWLRVTNPDSYEIAEAHIQALQKANTDLNRAITKLKMKTRK